MKYAVVIIGRICSGKSTLSRELSKTLNASLVSFGAYIKGICSDRGIEPSRENMQQVGNDLVLSNPQGLLIGAIESSVESDQGLLIFEGVRHKSILGFIRAQSERVVTIYMEAATNERFKRYCLREGLDDSAAARKRFEENDNHPVEAENELLKGSCDLILDTKGGIGANLRDATELIGHE